MAAVVSEPTSSALPKMESPTGPFNGTVTPRLEGVTQMHAASVNGDKAHLAKLIVSDAQDMDAGDQFGRTPLMFCVLADRLECAELLLKAGSQVNKKDKGGRTVLHWAAHKGNFRIMKLLLSKGANCREKDNEGQTGLHLCTRHKSAKCMTLLLRLLSPGEIDDQDKNKRTPLHWAASYGNLEHVKMLIKQDSNIGIPDVEGKTPLHWAASSRDPQGVKCVQLILETTPSVINWQDYEGRTALHLSVADGNEAIVNILTCIEKCNANALDNMFRTPLHWAAVLGHSKIVGLLLDSSADYASSDSNGATPLHYAAQNNYSDTVEVFLSRKIVTDEPDVEGRTAFMWAAGKGADDVIRIFMKHNVDIQQGDKNGGSALHAASLSGHSSTVKLLLQHSAKIDAADLLRHTPLFRACEMGHTDVVQTLIDYGARVDVLDQDGRSPLHWAALGGHAYICQTLIKYGVDPNIQDHSGRTPLQCAAYGGFVNCMSVLMEHKADPNAQENGGMTALHWACSKGHLDSVKLLIEYHAFPNHMEFTEDRYTPLDYALMGEYHDVAQYMIEQGALSITGIQDIAAQKIQSAFRGFRVRKTFSERKNLLMKHEMLKKEAAKKRAEEEYKRREDVKHKQEVSDRMIQDLSRQTLEDAPFEEDIESRPSTRSSRKKNVKVRTDEERLLARRNKALKVKLNEQERLEVFRRKQEAASIIQRSWKIHRYGRVAILMTAQQALKSRRLRAGQEAWIRQMAALKIQVAWRKYKRRKLIKSARSPKRNKQLQMWDPELMAAKQKAVSQQIYREPIPFHHWKPNRRPTSRPASMRHLSSAASKSYGFASVNYHPLSVIQGCQPTPFVDKYGHPKKVNGKSRRKREDDVSDKLKSLKLSSSKERKSRHFSYNMRNS